MKTKLIIDPFSHRRCIYTLYGSYFLWDLSSGSQTLYLQESVTVQDVPLLLQHTKAEWLDSK